MSIYDNLSKILQNRQITDFNLSKQLGWNQSILHSWKNGSIPRVDKIMEICNLLQITPNVLFGVDEPPPAPDLTQNDKEVLELLHRLSERDQIKMIGIIEQLVKMKEAQ